MVSSLLLVENVEDKNPKDNFGFTPLHEAAMNGRLSLCQLIVVNVDDKNPIHNYGGTPLHLAVCQLLVENITDKNPKDDFGRTPISIAVANNHLDIKKLIFFLLDIKKTLKS